MQELPNMQEMLDAAMAQASQECGTLLGQELEIRGSSGRTVTREEYLKGMENASFVVGIDSQEDYSGMIYLLLSFRDAIVVSGTLLGVPAPRIMEKKKLAIVESDDVDAFSEIANQLIGSFNAVFKRTLPQKAHLKQLPPKKYIPRQDPIDENEPLNDGEYYLQRAQLTLAGKELEQLDILIPLSLARLFDLRERSQETLPVADSDEAPATVSQEEAGAIPAEPAAVLILDDDATQRQQFQEMLASSGVSPLGATLDADLKKLLSHKGLKAVLVAITTANDQELSICLKISANLKGISIPIIMCAREWTRSAVLKALKYGAGDIMMTPFSPDELTTKVQKLVEAA